MNFVNLSVRVLFLITVAILSNILIQKAGLTWNNFYLRLVIIGSIVLLTKYNPVVALGMSIIFILNEITNSKDDTDNPNN